MTIETPIQVFVGTEKEQLLALKVLEYSISQHSSLPVKVTPLFEAIELANIKIPSVTDPEKRPRTPFSFQRFAIPELKSYRGRAIYLDSDMQVFQDIAELWLWDFQGADILSVCELESSQRASQFSVMVLNCAQINWKIEDIIDNLNQGKWTYTQLMSEMAPANKIDRVLPSKWNDLERYNEGETALTHYTDMPNQPWLNVNNPLGWLWCRELFTAIEDKAIAFDFVEEQVMKGYVRPSLIYQLGHQIIDPTALPSAIIQLDKRHFSPPHAWRKPIKLLMDTPYLPASLKRNIYQVYTEMRGIYQSRKY